MLNATVETAGPRLFAMLCVLAVFIPAFFMQGAAKALFTPLALAVGFTMVASFVLCSTLGPALASPAPLPHRPNGYASDMG